MDNLKKIIEQNIWSFGSNNNQDHFGHIAFYNGVICGYQNPNEVTYEITSDSLIFYTKDKQQSNIFQFSDFDGKIWKGKHVLTPEQPEHFLSIVQKGPIPIIWRKQFINIAKKNKFYFQHYGLVENVYNENSIITAYPNANVESGATLALGLLTSIGRFSYISGENTTYFKVGRYSSIAMGVRSFGNAHPTTWLSSNPVFYTKHHQHLYKNATGIDYETNLFFEENPNTIPIHVGHDVWIGEDCLLKPGITIGDGAIIAARSIVTKDIPPYAIAAGTPATVKKFRFNQNIINRLLHLQWWNYHPHELHIDWSNPIKAIDQLEDTINSPHIKEIRIPKKDYCLEFLRANKSKFL